MQPGGGHLVASCGEVVVGWNVLRAEASSPARATVDPMPAPPDRTPPPTGVQPPSDATAYPSPEEAALIVSRFTRADGSLHTMPTARRKRLAVLDRIAQGLEPGRRYTESEVVQVLLRFHPDHAALRRYLVDEGFLTRSDGVYWRSGGTFDV